MPDPTHRGDIDGLRAIAVLGVLAYHAFPDQVPGGFTGVDVFFVISGFLISGIILGGLSRGAFSFREFYARRIRRIFPALLVVLATCWAIGWFILLADEYEALGTHIAGGAGFSSNFVLWNEVGYFDVASTAKPLLHLWSLGIEEQFYLLWPLVLVVTWRLRQRPLLVTCGLFAISFTINLATVGPSPSAAFYGPHARLWEILLGAALAQIAPRRVLSPAVANGLAGLGALGIIASVALTRETAFPGWWALLPTVGTALVIGAGPGAWLNRRVLALRPLIWIGLVSYPLYLWHWPLLVFQRILVGGAPSVVARLIVVGASLALATLTYRFVERPLRTGPLRHTRALLGAMLLMGCVGFFTSARDGLPNRAIQAAAPDFSSFGYDASPGCAEAHPYSASNAKCFESPHAHSQTLMILGDSHSEAIAPGFIAAAQAGSIGMDLLVLTKPGCVPFAHVEYIAPNGKPTMACRGYADGAIAEAIRDPRIAAVLLVGRFAYRATVEPFGDEPNLRGIPLGHYEYDDGVTHEERAPEVFRLGLEATARTLAAHRIELVFFDEPPELGFDPHKCVWRTGFLGLGDPRACGLPLATVMERQRPYRAITTDVLRRFPDAVRVDPVPLFCADDFCSPWVDGRMRYRDGDHLGTLGGMLVAPPVLAKLRERPWRRDEPRP